MSVYTGDSLRRLGIAVLRNSLLRESGQVTYESEHRYRSTVGGETFELSNYPDYMSNEVGATVTEAEHDTLLSSGTSLLYISHPAGQCMVLCPNDMKQGFIKQLLIPLAGDSLARAETVIYTGDTLVQDYSTLPQFEWLWGIQNHLSHF